MAREVVLKFIGDPSQLKAALKEMTSAHGVAMADVTKQAAAQAAQVLSAERDKNKQIVAMWAARGAEQTAIAAKGSQVEASYAKEAGQSVSQVQKEIIAAYAARNAEAQAIAKQEAAAWAQHEAGKLGATRVAEKQGEQIVAQANAAQIKAAEQRSATLLAIEKNTQAALKKEREAAAIFAQKTASQAAALQLRSLVNTPGNTSFDQLGNSLNVFIGQRIPLAGGAFIRLTENLRGFHAAAQSTEGSVLRLGKAINDISSKSGKSVSDVQSFLAAFVKLETQAEKDTHAISFFGAAVAQDLAPQLGRASAEMEQLAATTAQTGGVFTGMLAKLGPVGIAVAGIAVQLAAAGIVGKQFFDIAGGLVTQFIDLAKRSAEWRSSLLDASRQLGVSTETLSAFEILAKTTGSDLGTLSSSLGVFQRHLEDAQDPTSRSAKTFKELGVETLNTEDALRQTLARLARMPEGFRQTSTALEVFGRGGKSVLGILKDIDGDLDGAIKKLREMGLVLSREDALAASKLTGELALLEFRLRALLGKEAIPGATKAVQELGKFIDQNKRLIATFGTGITLAGMAVSGFARTVSDGLNVGLSITQSTLNLLVPQLGQVATALQILSRTDPFAKVKGGAGVPLEVGGSADAKLPGLKSGLLEQSLKASQNQAAREIESQRHLTESLKLDFDQRITASAEFYNSRKQLIEDSLKTLIAQIGRERAALKGGFSRGEIDQNELENAERDLSLRVTQAQNRATEDRRKLRAEETAERRKSDQTAIDILVATIETRVRIQGDADANVLESLRTLANARVITEEDAEKRILAIKLRANQLQQDLVNARSTAAGAIADEPQRRKVQADLALELAVLQKQAELIQEQGNRNAEAGRQVDLSNERKYGDDLLALKRRVLDQQRDNQRTEIALMIVNRARQSEIFKAQIQLAIEEENDRHTLAQKSISAQRRENLESNRTQEERLQRTAELNRLEEAEEARHNADMAILKAQRDRALREAGPEGGFLSGLETSQLAEFEDGIQSFADASIVALSAVGSVVNGLGQGIGNMLQNWILMGNQADISMKKMVAAVLAGVAQQAAVLAIFELAKGFGALFFNPAEAAAHFQAAALYASVAVASAVIGRAAAGTSFQNTVQGTGSGTGSTTGRSTATTTEPKTREVDRRSSSDGSLTGGHLTIKVQPPDGWVGQEFRKDYNLNGVTRLTILSDGQN